MTANSAGVAMVGRTAANEMMLDSNGQPVVDSDRNLGRMSAVVDFIFSWPILSARQAANGLGIPFKTAQAYIEKLVQARMLREITGFALNRIFQADEILSPAPSPASGDRSVSPFEYNVKIFFVPFLFLLLTFVLKRQSFFA